MATKADFSEEEWDALQRGLTGSGMLVSLADRDFTDSFGEAKAMAKFLAEEREQSTSTLIRDLAGVHNSGFGMTTSPTELEAGTVEALQSATATLAAKAPGDLEPYKQAVLGLAQRVAEAKGGVQETEAAAIEKLRAALEPAQ